MDENKDKFVLIGLSASGLLLAFYLIVSSLLGGFSFAVNNFVSLWYWMIPLIVGFGIQIGLFFYVKEEMHKKATAQAVASTGVSATSMIACCAHHIADIAPFLGITALGLFFTKYQSTFLLMGILSNLLGILYMVSLVKSESEASRNKNKKIFYLLLVLSIIIVFLSYYFISASEKFNEINTNAKQTSLQTLTNNKNNVEFQVTPLSSSEFQIAINTHSVALDFDLAEISTLYDDVGNVYKPLKWDGSASGGHHRSGILKFPEINKNSKSIKLIINDGAKREFFWNR